MERDYNEKRIRKEILRAEEHARKNLLKRAKPKMSEQTNVQHHLLRRFQKC